MQDLSLRKPPSLAIETGATSPTGEVGAVVWSTTEERLLVYDGTQWVPMMVPPAHQIVRLQGATRKTFVDYVSLTTLSITASNQYFLPITVPKKTTISQLELEVITAAAGSMSVGIYNNQVASNNDYPYQLLWGATNAIDIGTVGIKSVTVNPSLSLMPGIIYWVSLISNASPTLRVGSLARNNFALNDASFVNSRVGLVLSGSGSTLINPAPTSGYSLQVNIIFIITYT